MLAGAGDQFGNTSAPPVRQRRHPRPLAGATTPWSFVYVRTVAPFHTVKRYCIHLFEIGTTHGLFVYAVSANFVSIYFQST